ncbi:MAG TPA: BON domain-containing protein [Burkholderiales bacterium]|nr:BON domain-containing protein [Burkholderiales bacterium]
MSSLRSLSTGVFLFLVLAGNSSGQLNPFSALGKVMTITMDIRTKDEVSADTEIAAGASKRLLEDKKAEWSGVTVLVFAQHVVIAGAVKTAEAKKRVEEIVKRDRRIRSLADELLVGDVGSLARDTALEAEINATLTAASGVASVNMRWCATGGNVVLMGVAQSQREADIALQKTRAIKGVRSVKPHLRVVSAKK